MINFLVLITTILPRYRFGQSTYYKEQLTLHIPSQGDHMLGSSSGGVVIIVVIIDVVSVVVGVVVAIKLSYTDECDIGERGTLSKVTGFTNSSSFSVGPADTIVRT